MKLFIKKNQLGMTLFQFLRQAGYVYIRDNKMGHDSFVKELGSYHYPRLHMYVDEQDDKIIFNLHLDQKQASYKGSHMHNAEYDGPVVESEIMRIRGMISNSPKLENAAEENTLDRIGNGEYDKSAKPGPKKSWWHFWR